MAARAATKPAQDDAAAERRLLRFLTCGSVDDGKSTLIGRLLYDSRMIMDDTLSALERDSRKFGTVGEEIDLALLVDGLEAERQQGITIDVAYRSFATANRSFSVADTPGHEQYTRNMATGASHCDLAIILVDARKGVLVQTRRHSTICSLLGIRSIVLAINKIDLVDYSEAVFDRIVGDYATFAAKLGFTHIQPIPISARYGDNVGTRSGNMPWYQGPTLLGHLEGVEIENEAAELPLRFPVQWVNRPSLDFRGYSGTIVSGTVRPDDEIVVAGSGKPGKVARIVTVDGDLPMAGAGDAVTLVLDREIDIARGDILVPPQKRPTLTDQFAAHILWMDEDPLLPSRQYMLRIGNVWTPASVTSIKHRVDIRSLDHAAARTLRLNEIGFCNLSVSQRVALDPFSQNKATGSFILVDRSTNRTAGLGLVDFSLYRADNIHVENFLVDKAARAALNQQKPLVLWFTGLSGSGKSTIAKLVEQKLHLQGKRTFSLDGDNVRHGLNRDLGFSDADRVENIRRIGEVAKLFTEAGLIVICAFISPFEAERRMLRGLLTEGEFVEIFVDTPIEECMKRDPKGLYAKAKRGEIRNFTGIDSPYETPEDADLRIETVGRNPEEAADLVLAWLELREV